jgi:hypothetical protein
LAVLDNRSLRLLPEYRNCNIESLLRSLGKLVLTLQLNPSEIIDGLFCRKSCRCNSGAPFKRCNLRIE